MTHCCGRQYSGFSNNYTVLPYDPAISILGICPKELKAVMNKYLYTNVHSSIIHYSPKVEINVHQHLLGTKKFSSVLLGSSGGFKN